MTDDTDARFVISAPLGGSALGFVNHNGDVVSELAGAMAYGYDQAVETATALAARLRRGVYIQPLLQGQIDVDADPIWIAPPEPSPSPVEEP